MTASLLLIPFFLIRFGLLSFLSRDAVRRAAYFAPLPSRERVALWVYQLSNGGIFLSLFFLKVGGGSLGLALVGGVLLAVGAVLLTGTVVAFAAPAQDGMNRDGIYRRSRNPMYLAYFFYFMGCVFLTRSWLLLGFVLAFQLSTHWIILAEERWCIQKFGGEYLAYMERVGRYF